jgi:hypothetical protein
MVQARRLRLGRHFRLPGGSKLVIGRNQEENERLLASLGEGDLAIVTVSCPGPTAIISGPGAASELEVAASMVARYGDDKTSAVIEMNLIGPDENRPLSAGRMDPEEVAGLMI